MYIVYTLACTEFVGYLVITYIPEHGSQSFYIGHAIYCFRLGCYLDYALKV